MASDLYNQPNLESQQQSKSSNKLWFFLLGGCGCACFMLLSVGGIGVLAILGLNGISADIEVQLRDHPQVRQHLGELQSLEFDFSKSSINQDDAFVYTATGSEGSAEMTVVSESSFDNQEQIHSVTMRLQDGQVIELDFDTETDF